MTNLQPYSLSLKMNCRSGRSKKGTTLVEAIIVVAVFSLLGLLLGSLTESFVEAYLRLRDQVDLQRMSTALVREIGSGDDANFDGLRAAFEILEANDRELSFVPQFRDSSKKASAYLDNLYEPFNSSIRSRDSEGNSLGELRIAVNDSDRTKCELRYYLASHPRAGAGKPSVYLRYDPGVYDENSPLYDSKLAEGGDKGTWIEVPVTYFWNPHRNGFSESYFYFGPSLNPVSFKNIGSAELAICEGPSAASKKMRDRKDQKFPNPFDRPKDQFVVYYHPETDAKNGLDQEDLRAHLFFKNAYADQIDRFNLDSQAASALRNPDPGRRGIHDNALLLYYRSGLRVLPSQASFQNANLHSYRLQFPFQPIEDDPMEPSRFSYFSSRNTTEPIPMELEDGRLRVPSELLANIGFLRFDLLALFGGSFGDTGIESFSKRNFTQLLPLDVLRYTHRIHTQGARNYPDLGFSSSQCIQPGGLELDNVCRKITRDLPSGKAISLSQTLYISEIERGSSDFGTSPRMNFIFRKSDKVYKVSVDFSSSSITVRLKDRYTDTESAVTSNTAREATFALNNPRLINFTDLDPTTPDDEEFQYTNQAVRKHLDPNDNEEGGVEFYVEVSKNPVTGEPTIAGFSLTFAPN